MSELTSHVHHDNGSPELQHHRDPNNNDEQNANTQNDMDSACDSNKNNTQETGEKERIVKSRENDNDYGKDDKEKKNVDNKNDVNNNAADSNKNNTQVTGEKERIVKSRENDNDYGKDDKEKKNNIDIYTEIGSGCGGVSYITIRDMDPPFPQKIGGPYDVYVVFPKGNELSLVIGDNHTKMNELGKDGCYMTQLGIQPRPLNVHLYVKQKDFGVTFEVQEDFPTIVFVNSKSGTWSWKFWSGSEPIPVAFEPVAKRITDHYCKSFWGIALFQRFMLLVRAFRKSVNHRSVTELTNYEPCLPFMEKICPAKVHPVVIRSGITMALEWTSDMLKRHFPYPSVDIPTKQSMLEILKTVQEIEPHETREKYFSFISQYTSTEYDYCLLLSFILSKNLPQSLPLLPTFPKPKEFPTAFQDRARTLLLQSVCQICYSERNELPGYEARWQQIEVLLNDEHWSKQDNTIDSIREALVYHDNLFSSDTLSKVLNLNFGKLHCTHSLKPVEILLALGSSNLKFPLSTHRRLTEILEKVFTNHAQRCSNVKDAILFMKYLYSLVARYRACFCKDYYYLLNTILSISALAVDTFLHARVSLLAQENIPDHELYEKEYKVVLEKLEKVSPKAKEAILKSVQSEKKGTDFYIDAYVAPKKKEIEKRIATATSKQDCPSVANDITINCFIVDKQAFTLLNDAWNLVNDLPQTDNPICTYIIQHYTQLRNALSDIVERVKQKEMVMSKIQYLAKVPLQHIIDVFPDFELQRALNDAEELMKQQQEFIQAALKCLASTRRLGIPVVDALDTAIKDFENKLKTLPLKEIEATRSEWEDSHELLNRLEKVDAVVSESPLTKALEKTSLSGETMTVPSGASIKKLMEICVTYRCKVVEIREDFWRKIDNCTLTVSELDPLINYSVFCAVLAKDAHVTEDVYMGYVTERIQPELDVITNIGIQGHINQIKRNLGDVLEYEHQRAHFQDIVQLCKALDVPFERDTEKLLTRPILEDRSRCTLQEISNIMTDIRTNAPEIFKISPRYTAYLKDSVITRETEGLPEVLNIYIPQGERSDYEKKIFEDTEFYKAIESETIELHDNENEQILWDFREVVKYMFEFSRKLLMCVAGRSFATRKRLMQFLVGTAKCEGPLGRIRDQYTQIKLLKNSDTVEASTDIVRSIVEKGQYIIKADENGEIILGACKKVRNIPGAQVVWDIDVTWDKLKDVATQFIFLNTERQEHNKNDSSKKNDKDAITKGFSNASRRLVAEFPTFMKQMENIVGLFEEMRSVGHPLLEHLPVAIPGNFTKFEDWSKELQEALEEWRAEVDVAQQTYPMLYLCPRSLLQRLCAAIETFLQEKDLNYAQRISNTIVELVCAAALLDKKPSATGISECLDVVGEPEAGKDEAESKIQKIDSFSIVASILKRYLKSDRLLKPIQQTAPSAIRKTVECLEFSQDAYRNALLYLVTLYWERTTRLPVPFEVLLCSSQTTRVEVEDFLNAWEHWNECQLTDHPAIFCVVGAHLLSRVLQDVLVQRITSITQREKNAPSLILLLLKSSPVAHQLYQNQAVVQDVSTQATETPSKELLNHFEKRLESMAHVVYSDMAGCGKTTHVRQLANSKGMMLTTLPIQRGSNIDTVLQSLRHSDTARQQLPQASSNADGVAPKGLLFHLDISAFAKPEVVQEILFLLFVEGRLINRKGDTLQLNASDFIVIEIPNEGKYTTKYTTKPTLSTVPLLQLFPSTKITDLNFGTAKLDLVPVANDPSGRLAHVVTRQVPELDFGAKCLHIINKLTTDSLPSGHTIEDSAMPSSKEVSAALQKLFPEAKTTLARSQAYTTVSYQLHYALVGTESLFYNTSDDRILSKTALCVAKLIIQTTNNICGACIPSRQTPDETEASRLARTKRFSDWCKEPFSIFNAGGDFRMLTLSQSDGVLQPYAEKSTDQPFKNFIDEQYNKKTLNRIKLEQHCQSLGDTELNVDTLNHIIPIIAMSPHVGKLLFQLKPRDSLLKKYAGDTPISTIPDKDMPEAVKWLLKFIETLPSTVSFKRATTNTTVEDVIFIIRAWMFSLFVGVHPETTPPFVMTPDLIIRDVALKLRLVARTPVVIIGEQGCGKTALCDTFARGSGCPFFFVSCNGAVTPEVLWEKLQDAVDCARKNEEMNVLVQLDEGNCLYDNWTLHQAMIDGCVDGKFLPRNIQFIVMLNPTKERTEEQQAIFNDMNTLAGMDYKFYAEIDEEKSKKDARKVYDVAETPETVFSLGFDFGTAATTFSDAKTIGANKQRAEYVPLPHDKRKGEVSNEFRFASNDVQWMIKHGMGEEIEDLHKEYARADDREGLGLLWRAYSTILVTCIRAGLQRIRDVFKNEESMVSLRDIRKVCRLIPFIFKCYCVREKLSHGTGNAQPNTYMRFLTESTCAALIMTYYLRLKDSEREETLRALYNAWGKARNHFNKLPEDFCAIPPTPKHFYEYFDNIAEYVTSALTDENDDDLAMVAALKENTFSLVACAKLRMNLFIVGRAGSSKSRAVNAVQAASDRQCPFFKEIEFEMKTFVLQCTHMTTAKEVQSRAVTAAVCQNREEGKCVALVLEEVGATTNSDFNPLMSLHNIIDHGVQLDDGTFQYISVIGVSNWFLGSAKMGRFIVVNRDIPDIGSLITTGEKILGKASFTSDVSNLCKQIRINVLDNENQYRDKKEAKLLGRFFGMRDFYHCLKLLPMLLSLSEHPLGRNLVKEPHVVRTAVAMAFGGLPATPENYKLEKQLNDQLLKAFPFKDEERATYRWYDTPKSEPQYLCDICAKMAFQKKWLVHMSSSSTPLEEASKRELFLKHARPLDNRRDCEGFAADLSVPPSAALAIHIAAFTLLHPKSRHLMVFGEAGSVIALLRLHGLLPRVGPLAATIVYACSNEGIENQLRVVKGVMAKGGHLVVQGLALSERLLEAANLNYMKRSDGTFWTRLPMANGSSKMIPCDSNFRITMIVGDDEAHRALPPVVQRFTKVTLSYMSLLTIEQQKIMKEIEEKSVIQWKGSKVSLLKLLIPGYTKESLAMLIVTTFAETMESNDNDEKKESNVRDDGGSDKDSDDNDAKEERILSKKDTIYVRLAMSFSPQAFAIVERGIEAQSSENIAILEKWKDYFSNSPGTRFRKHSLEGELGEARDTFIHARHTLLLTRQPEPSLDIVCEVFENLLRKKNECANVEISRVSNNHTTIVQNFTNELQNIISYVEEEDDPDCVGLVVVPIDLTSISKARELWTTFRNIVEEALGGKPHLPVYVVVVATVEDPLHGIRAKKEMLPLHYTNDWLLLHVDEISTSVLKEFSLHDIETRELSVLCESALTEISSNAESLLELAQQLWIRTGEENVSAWYEKVKNILESRIGQVCIEHLGKLLQECATQQDWISVALQHPRETMRLTCLRYILRVAQLALLPLIPSLDITRYDEIDASWQHLLEERLLTFLDIPPLKYCFEPSYIADMSTVKDVPIEKEPTKLPCSRLVLSWLLNFARRYRSISTEEFATEVERVMPFYDTLSADVKVQLFEDALLVVTPAGEKGLTTEHEKRKARELVRFYSIEGTPNPPDSETLALLLLSVHQPDIVSVIYNLARLLQVDSLSSPRSTLYIHELITELTQNNVMSLSTVRLLESYAGGCAEDPQYPFNIRWHLCLATINALLPNVGIKSLALLREKALIEKKLSPGLTKELLREDLSTVRLFLCRELVGDLCTEEHVRGWAVLGLTSPALQRHMRFFLAEPWLRAMLLGNKYRRCPELENLSETEELTTFTREATYRILESLGDTLPEHIEAAATCECPSGLLRGARLGCVMSALNNIVANPGVSNANMTRFVDIMLRNYTNNEIEQIALFALRQGTHDGVVVQHIKALAKRLVEVNSFSKSKYLTSLLMTTEAGVDCYYVGVEGYAAAKAQLENKGDIDLNNRAAVLAQLRMRYPRMYDSPLNSAVILLARSLIVTASDQHSIAGWYRRLVDTNTAARTPLPGITTSMEYDLVILDRDATYIYECPNKHKYNTNACMYIQQESLCRVCGARIGRDMSKGGGHFDVTLHKGNRQLGRRSDFEGKVDLCEQTVGFALSPQLEKGAAVIRGVEKFPITLLVLSVLSFVAATPEIELPTLESRDILTSLLTICGTRIFGTAKTDVAAGFLVELFTRATHFFTSSAVPCNNRNQIEQLCMKSLTTVEQCRVLYTKKTEGIDTVAAVQSLPSAEQQETVRFSLQSLVYHQTVVPQDLLNQAAQQHSKLMAFQIAARSITKQAASDLMLFLEFVKLYESTCDRKAELRLTGTVADVIDTNPELQEMFTRVGPSIDRMFQLVERPSVMACVNMKEKFTTLVQNIVNRRNMGNYPSSFLMFNTPKNDAPEFIQGVYCGVSDNADSFVVAQNKLLKEVKQSSKTPATAISSASQLLAVNLQEDLVRITKECYIDYTQPRPTLSSQVVENLLTHLSAHCRLPALAPLPESCGATIVRPQNAVVEFMSTANCEIPQDDVFGFLREVRELRSDVADALFALLRHVTRLASKRSDLKSTSLLTVVIPDDKELTQEQRIGNQCLRAERVLVKSRVDHLLFLLAMTYTGGVPERYNFNEPLEETKLTEVRTAVEGLEKKHLWELYRVMVLLVLYRMDDVSADWDMFSTFCLFLPEESQDALDDLFSDLLFGHLGVFWNVVNEVFWKQEVTENTNRGVLLSISDLFRSAAVAATAETNRLVPGLRLARITGVSEAPSSSRTIPLSARTQKRAPVVESTTDNEVVIMWNK